MKTNFLKIIAILGLGLLFINCRLLGQSNKNNNGVSSITIKDSVELTDLIRKVYKWHETGKSKTDFKPIASEKKYIALDLNALSKRLKEIETTSFFSKDFIDNYNKIAQTINTNLINGSMIWLIGDLPPFGNDANPWCNCQDNPEEYWESMTITKIKTNNNQANFKWTWDNKTFYNVIAIKKDNLWKVQYLQGFDIINYK